MFNNDGNFLNAIVMAVCAAVLAAGILNAHLRHNAGARTEIADVFTPLLGL